MSKAKQIKLVIFDVDGVLTDGKLYFTNSGEESKAFNSKDGIGIKMLLHSGIDVAIITGRKSTIVARRARELGIKHLYQGNNNKQAVFADLVDKLQLQSHEIAYIGDDINDLAIMQHVGLSVAPANALSYIKEAADFVCERDGGDGAARELCDSILLAQNKWHAAAAEYGYEQR